MAEQIRQRSKSRTRWRKMAMVRERQIPCIQEEDETTSNSIAIFEKVNEQKSHPEIRSQTLYSLAEILRDMPERNGHKVIENDSVKNRKVTEVDLKKTIFDMNWNRRRSMAGYFGCADCEICRISKFGDRFKNQFSGIWYKIKDTIDCSDQNVLYIATCLICESKLQYAGSAVDMNDQLKKLKHDTKNAGPREKPENELSRHFAEVHGGWYADGVQLQLLKIVTQEDFPNINAALEYSETSMVTQLSLYVPNGMNLRKEDRVARRNSIPNSIDTPSLSIGLSQVEPGAAKVSRWSRLDYFHNKPKQKELTDIAELLLQQARVQDESQ